MSLQLLAAAAQDSTHALGHTEPPDATALSAASAASAESALRKKRRSRRACDKCNLSRTRCNNENPCSRCRDYDYICSYTREVKKRGRRQKQFHPSQAIDTRSAAKDAPRATAQPPAVNSDASKGFLTLEPSNISSDREEAARVLPSPQAATLHWLGYHDEAKDFHGSRGTVQSSTLTLPVPNRASHLLLSDLTSSLPLENTPDTTRSEHLSPLNLRRQSYVGGESNIAESPQAPGTFPFPTITTPSSFAPNSTRTPGHINESPIASFASPIISNSGPADPPNPCRYPILEPLLPILRDIMPTSVACDLLQLYFDQPGSSLLKCASPYVLTHVLRRRAVLHPTNPRETSLALLLAMLLATAHTADIASFHVPGSRTMVCDKLYTAIVEHLCDPDDWHRLLSGVWVMLGSREENCSANESHDTRRKRRVVGPNAGTDELLTLILVTIVVSGGTFKADCLPWWNKALRLGRSLKLIQLDDKNNDQASNQTFLEIEAAEEKRRVFWLLFSLDRHLALSYNAPLAIHDADICVYLPLPEALWEDLDLRPLPIIYNRTYGPKTTISGTDFFQFFLPLMTILGDIVLLHHRRLHPRFGALNDAAETAVVEKLLDECKASLKQLQDNADAQTSSAGAGTPRLSAAAIPSDSPSGEESTAYARACLVTVYSTHILHVLAVLLYGIWDPIAMLTASSSPLGSTTSATGLDGDDWMTPTRFMKCASHAVSASQAVASIITLDPELVYMPYLFGIYLLHGSFILLLFADRMPQLGGPNPEVEQACETIVRAHEVCVVTLSTEFQRSFRRVLRSTLYSVRSAAPSDIEESQARRNALEMYRWARGGRGLAL